jgi:dTDP-4-dehydrorhamnose 3,5-epimerase
VAQVETATIAGLEFAVKDRATVTSDGEPVREPIAGVSVHHPRTQADERGTLCEVYDSRWGFTDEAVTFVYVVTINPGQVKGWSVHLAQDDRMFFEAGTTRLTLYDGRRASETFGNVNVLHAGAHDRALVRIPPGVYHAVRNVGDDVAVFLNLPSHPYDHGAPDKYRLPLDTLVIPVQP